MESDIDNDFLDIVPEMIDGSSDDNINSLDVVGDVAQTEIRPAVWYCF